MVYYIDYIKYYVIDYILYNNIVYIRYGTCHGFNQQHQTYAIKVCLKYRVSQLPEITLLYDRYTSMFIKPFNNLSQLPRFN